MLHHAQLALVILSPSALVLVLALLVLPTQQPTVLRLSASVRQATTTQTQSSQPQPRSPPVLQDIVALVTVRDMLALMGPIQQLELPLVLLVMVLISTPILLTVSASHVRLARLPHLTI